MVWFLADMDERRIVKEIEGQSDRGAAIIAGSMVEERLAAAILSRLHPMSTSLRGTLFDGYGPLATFKAKIDIGFALGLYGPITRNALNEIRRIRNRFAHSIEPLTFAAVEIKERCQRLELPRLIADDSALTTDADGRVIDNDQWTPPAEAREQYIRAAQLLIGLLWSEANAKLEPQPKLFGPRFLTF